MGEDEIRLDHIALYVTNLEKSRNFYRDVLHMSVSEPISLREQSSGLKYGHSIITHSPKLVRNWISKNKPAAYQDMFTEICHCSAADGKVNLILVQKTHPEKGYTRSVTGNTLYGFSFYLSADVDTDDLGWDMDLSDISFEHGDSRTDGTVYSPENLSHSLFIRDPDGRMIELIPSENRITGEFITGPGHVVLYVTDMQKSIRYYQQVLGLSDITGPGVPRDPWKKNITWLGIPGSPPVILIYQVTNPDGTRVETGGYGLDHIALSGTHPEQAEMIDPVCVTGHPYGKTTILGYIQDPDGYFIEC